MINLPKKSSFFLFGARATGKSTLLEEHFKTIPSLWIDLLDLDEEARLQTDPMALSRQLEAVTLSNPEIQWVIIDEIQKVPPLLDIIHKKIEKKRFKFALTGSSARKLKRGAGNLLAGRAIQTFLFPLTFLELGSQFDLNFVLQWGSLPHIFGLSEEECKDYLRTYGNLYLKEEIQAEQLVRKLPPFRSFLETAAQSSGEIVNYSNIARDIGSDPVSVKSYYEILEDTYFGLHLPPFHQSIRKRQRSNPKFYFFDLGVENALQKLLNVPLAPKTYRYGKAFEKFIVTEIDRLNRYLKKDWTLFYLKTKDGAEIDLVIERPGSPLALIEIKSKTRIVTSDLIHLKSLAPDIKNSQAFCLSLDPTPQVINGIHCLPWEKGFQEIGI